MSLSEEERYALVSYRVEKAHATFEQAKANVANGYWDLIANRLYYAAYYATSALLLQNGYSVQTHNGIIQMLGLHFIKTGKLDKRWGNIYSRLFANRQTGDYGDMFGLTEEQVLPLVSQTEEYINVICSMIENAQR